MANPKFFRFPFASTGDKETIPDEAQSSGALSYAEGFGLDYERDPLTDAKAKRMPRDGTNQVLYDATSNIQQYQLYGAPFWYDASNNGGTAIQYQKNAIVRYFDGLSENLYISLKDNNTDTPTVETSWFLFAPYDATYLSRLSVAPFVAVESMSLTTPPTTPITGKLYLVPANATGAWANKNNQIAEWNGKDWLFTKTDEGHGIGLPDGRIFIKTNGAYVEKLALDTQSGKWNFAQATGSANTLTATLMPQPQALFAGMSVHLKIKTTNTGASTLNINSLGAKPIVYHETGEALVGSDFQIGDVIKLVFDGMNWRLQPSIAYFDTRYSRLAAPPTDTYYVLPTGNDDNTGFAPTSAEGFKTISGAIKSLTERYMTSETIKLVIAAGTYDGFTVPPSFIGGWRITGDISAPNKVIIDSTKSTSKYTRGANVSTDGVIIEGLTIAALDECIYFTGGSNLRLKDCNLILGGSNATAVTSYNGNVSLAGTIKITGSGLAALYARKGEIRLGVTELNDAPRTRIEFNCSVSMANFYAQATGLIYINPNLTTHTGTCVGRRFYVNSNGVILLNGVTTPFIPGTAAGVTESGGFIG